MGLRTYFILFLAIIVLLGCLDSHSAFVRAKKSKCREPSKKKKKGNSCRKPKPPAKKKRAPPPPPMVVTEDAYEDDGIVSWPAAVKSPPPPPPSPPPPSPPSPPPPPPAGPVLSSYTIVGDLNRDRTIYTQGIEIHKTCDDCDYSDFSSAGLYGSSRIAQFNLESGEMIRSRDLPADEFGEGLTILDDKIYQLIWKSNKMYVYDVNDFNNRQEKEHPQDNGWGLTDDGVHLILSNSSNILSFVDPSDLSLVKQVPVTFDGTDVVWINEMEWVDGLIYANIYQRDCIAKIDPSNGDVVGWIDASGLRDKVEQENPAGESEPSPQVLNGIAVKPIDSSTLYVTGKYWPKTYVIKEEPLYDGKPMNKDQMNEIKDKCMVPEAASLG